MVAHIGCMVCRICCALLYDINLSALDANNTSIWQEQTRRWGVGFAPNINWE